jgi:hypothetical protein
MDMPGLVPLAAFPQVPRALPPPAVARMTASLLTHFFRPGARFYNTIVGRRSRPAIAFPTIASGASIRIAGDSFSRIRPLQGRPRCRHRGMVYARVRLCFPG